MSAELGRVEIKLNQVYSHPEMMILCLATISEAINKREPLPPRMWELLKFVTSLGSGFSYTMVNQGGRLVWQAEQTRPEQGHLFN